MGWGVRRQPTAAGWRPGAGWRRPAGGGGMGDGRPAVAGWRRPAGGVGMAAGRGPAGWRTPGGGPAQAGGMEAGRRRPRPPLLQIRPEGKRRDGGRPAAARRGPAGWRPVAGGLALPSPRSGRRGSGEMGGRPLGEVRNINLFDGYRLVSAGCFGLRHPVGAPPADRTGR
uniref:Uncharacterized protein n=1 Tax=Oryza sativa subsp. japonica TaxID=39947 RepID=Q6K9A1_ORYSJ|nr:hypothetical protein [Oryza sativa Japonica Group]BAD19249.1 hypothetical protein [Oryza sativa Japonica Group]